jgi:hypothetical protein
MRAAEIETESGLGNVVAAIAPALRPGVMLGFPSLRTALLPATLAPPGALLGPSALLLPCDRLSLRPARLLPGLRRSLLLRLPLVLSLSGWSALLLLPGLRRSLLLRLPLVLLLSGWSALALLLLLLPATPLRLLFSAFGLAVFFVLVALLRRRRAGHSKKQKHGSGAGNSNELHTIASVNLNFDEHAEGQFRKSMRPVAAVVRAG